MASNLGLAMEDRSTKGRRGLAELRRMGIPRLVRARVEDFVFSIWDNDEVGDNEESEEEGSEGDSGEGSEEGESEDEGVNSNDEEAEEAWGEDGDDV